MAVISGRYFGCGENPRACVLQAWALKGFCGVDRGKTTTKTETQQQTRAMAKLCSNSEVGVIGHGNSVLTSQKLPKFPPPTPIYDSEMKNKKQTKQRKKSYLAFYKVAKYQCW